MKFKKYLAFIMAFICLLSLSGCQKGKEENSSVGAETAASEGNVLDASTSENENTSSAGEDVVLNFWYTDTNMTEFFTDAVSRYQESNPGVTVNLRMVASN